MTSQLILYIVTKRYIMIFIKRLNLKYLGQQYPEPIEISETKILGITIFKSHTYELDECTNGEYAKVEF